MWLKVAELRFALSVCHASRGAEPPDSESPATLSASSRSVKFTPRFEQSGTKGAIQRLFVSFCSQSNGEVVLDHVLIRSLHSPECGHPALW